MPTTESAVFHRRFGMALWICVGSTAGFAVMLALQQMSMLLVGGNLLLALGFFALRAWALAPASEGRMAPAVVLCGALGILATAWNAAFTGGLYSVSLWFLACIPVLLGFVVSARQGLLWAGISLLVITGFALAHWLGWLPSLPVPVPLYHLAFSQGLLVVILAGYAVIARRANDGYMGQLREAYDALQQQKEKLQSQAQALNESLRETEQARTTADAANRAKSSFLQMMSHEIRTPLNGVIGLNSLLLEMPLDRKSREYAELARQSGETLLSLMNDFLDFSKIEAGQLNVVVQPFDANQLARELGDFIRPGAEQKGISLQIDVAVPALLHGDADRLRQILLNLLANAVKFTERGEVRLSSTVIERPDHRIWLRFEVRDTGIGIAEDVQRRLFRPFMQADDSTSRRYGGTGLGLAICRSLAALMGGQTGFSSTPGMGSLFWVELPFDAKSASDQRPGLAAGSNAAPGAMRRRGRALVAEDNRVNQLVAVQMLERLGFAVDVASDGQQAADAALHHPYDLIFMDCHMPELDGYAASRLIRKREGGRRHVPIIAMTASAMSGDREQCLAAGMDDYLAKPVRLGDIERIVGAWVKA
ncbi:MAG: ATP-binding protein [Gammaproteobacteria bacterium]